MRSFFLFLSLTLITQKVDAQFTFVNDSTYKPAFDFYIKQIEDSFHLEKNASFEFRFWTTSVRAHKVDLFILSYVNQKWVARLFLHDLASVDRKFTEKHISNDSLEALWRELNNNHLLTIPNRGEVRDSSGNYAEVTVLDGIRFRFELITANSQRGFSYQCPKVNAEGYSYIEPFKWVVNIITLIYRYCEIPLLLC